jgi:di/tricarboxylate transporter
MDKKHKEYGGKPLEIESGISIAENKKNKGETIKFLTLLFTAAVLFGPFSLRLPVAALSTQGHWALAIILFTLAAWIVHPERLPRGVAGVLMMGLLLATGLPYGTVFYGFTTSAVWIVIPAFLFGYVIQETGLGSHIALRILKRFGGSMVGMAGALMLIGIIFSVLTPSTTVRIAIVMPIVLNVVKSLRLERHSRESAFLTLIAYTAVLIPGNGWMTGSLIGPVSVGLLPAQLQAELNWTVYSRGLIVPWSLISLLLFAYLFIIFQPKKLAIPISNEAEETLASLTKKQWTTGFVLSGVFLGYLTTPLHGLEAATITAVALFLLFATGLLNAGSISKGVNWEVVLFFGSIMSIIKVLEATGVSAILGQRLSPLMMRFSGNVALFIYLMIALSLTIRFLDVAWGLPTVAVLFSFAPVLAAAGIHPIVLCFLNGVIQYFVFFNYMSPFAIMSGNILEQRGWNERHLVTFGLGYILCVGLAVLPSIWYWRLLGLL